MFPTYSNNYFPCCGDGAQLWIFWLYCQVGSNKEFYNSSWSVIWYRFNHAVSTIPNFHWLVDIFRYFIYMRPGGKHLIIHILWTFAYGLSSSSQPPSYCFTSLISFPSFLFKVDVNVTSMSTSTSSYITLVTRTCPVSCKQFSFREMRMLMIEIIHTMN